MRSSTGRFIRHYVELVAVMVVGMVVLGVPANAVLNPSDRVWLLLVEAAVSMTAPVVVWMRFRGYSWRLCGEMTAAVLIPTLGALGLLAAGLITNADTLFLLEHAIILPSMLAAMLVRRDEYSAHRPVFVGRHL